MKLLKYFFILLEAISCIYNDYGLPWFSNVLAGVISLQYSEETSFLFPFSQFRLYKGEWYPQSQQMDNSNFLFFTAYMTDIYVSLCYDFLNTLVVAVPIFAVTVMRKSVVMKTLQQ